MSKTKTSKADAVAEVAATPSVIEAIRALEDHGRITPARVVEAARDPESPLHRYIDWDDTTAARKYRLVQARNLIRVVIVRMGTPSKTVLAAPRYVRDPEAAPGAQGYISVPVLAHDPDSAARAVTDEFKRADSCLKRAELLADALGVRAVVADARKKVAVAAMRVQTAVAQQDARAP